jgi:hypothetical protein
MPPHVKNKQAQRNRTTQSLSRGARGFTLIELMAAMTGGLFMTVAIYAFTRDVTEFFQRQMRIADATINAASGFERLRADIARAGFLSSPNLARDRNLCPRPPVGATQVPTQYDGFPGIQEMALAKIVSGATVAEESGNFMWANNPGLDPDELTLFGNYTTAEVFPARAVNVAGSEIFLEPNSAAMTRLGADASPAILDSVFRPGRIVRVVDETGREQYGILDDPAVEIAGPQISLKLSPLIALIAKDGVGATCGFRGHGAGATVNPVDIIRYRLVNLETDNTFARLFDEDILADATRLDLVREQLAPDTMEPIEGTRELIAEYAVDLRFGITANNANGENTYYDETDNDRMNFADVPFGTSAESAGFFGPHLIRGIHARLTVRTREAEFSSALPANATRSDQLYRVQIAGGEYARVRSLRAHIATRNSRTEIWQ